MNINRKAKQFMEQYELKKKGVDLQSITNAAISMGYEVAFFNPNKESHIELLKKVTNDFYDRQKQAVTSELNGRKTIFIIFFSSEQDKIFLLLHELAHIYLDHDYKSGITDTAKEIQANDFASYVIKHGNPKRLLPALIAGTVIATVFLTALSAVFIYKSILPKAETSVLIQSPPPTETTPPTQEQTIISIPESVQIPFSDSHSEQPTTPESTPAPTIEPTPQPTPQQTIAVYITRTGKKYHRQDCYHISGTSTFSININEAISTGYEACKSCRPNN